MVLLDEGHRPLVVFIIVNNPYAGTKCIFIIGNFYMYVDLVSFNFIVHYSNFCKYSPAYI